MNFTVSLTLPPAGGNAFIDLGFPPDEAVKLLAETDKAILVQIATNGSSAADSTT